MRSSTPIYELPLSTSTLTSLKVNGIMTVGQLMGRTPRELMRLPRIGRRSLSEIQNVLAALGFALSGTSFEGKLEPEPEPEPDLDKWPNLRDYFAAKALQGILAGGAINTGIKSKSEMAYAYADAMIEARGK